VRFLAALLLDKFAATVPVPATLVCLSDVVDALRLGTIDVLKVVVEGAEEAVLAGIEERHWRRVQQVRAHTL
jgi:FkbM family methyltransferase